MPDELLLRGIERLLAVVFAGAAIYFGYRLFLAIPDARGDGRAEIALSKDRRLLFTRLAPGTFFALFGTAVLITSYLSPVTKGVGGIPYSGFNPAAVPSTPQASTPVPSATAPSLDELRLALAFLADLETAGGGEVAGYDATSARRRFQNLRLQLMQSTWQTGWGDPLQFALWLEEAPPRSPNPAFERALAVMEGSEG
jgi:hypothetical protein